MVIVVSLLTAGVFGAGDFFGGLAAKRATILQVVAGSHLVGLAGVLALSLLVAGQPRPADLALGAAGGAFGGIGVALLYRRLAMGPMHIVAPLTAITSAAVPTVWSVAIGERLSVIAWSGVALGLVAIGLVSWAVPDRSRSGGADGLVRVVGESLLAGCGFGILFIFFDATDPAAAPWPVVGARTLTSAALIGFAVFVARGPVFAAARADRALIVAAGLLDVMANVGFLYASAAGQLAIVAVLTSLYPISTIALARLVLSERMNVIQGAGAAAALGATALIAGG